VTWEQPEAAVGRLEGKRWESGKVEETEGASWGGKKLEAAMGKVGRSRVGKLKDEETKRTRDEKTKRRKEEGTRGGALTEALRSRREGGGRAAAEQPSGV
jgi:hypothetical protein